MNSQVPRPHRSPIIWIVAAVIGLVLVAIVLVPRIGNNGNGKVPDKPQATAMPVEECRSLLAARNLGLGYLENENFAKAEPYLKELVAKLRRDPIGVRNFAILKLLSLDTKHDSAEQLRQAFAAAGLAAQQLLEVEPDSYVAHLLAGRVEFEAVTRLTDMQPGDQLARAREGVKELQQAAKLAPREPAILWTLFDKGRYVEDEEVKAAARQALKEAYALDPRNLFILTEWLRAQADANDPEIIATLKSAKDALAPVREGVKKRARVDVFELVDQALAAAEKPDWKATLGFVLRIWVIRSEDMAQSDRRRLDRHPLEYVVQRFGPEFCNIEDLKLADPDPEIPVKLATEAATTIEGLREVHDVVAADFDLDTRMDLAVLQTSALALYRRNPDSGAWENFGDFAPLEGMEHLLVADLDRDVHSKPRGAAPKGPGSGCQDADPDIVAYGAGGIRVLRNELDPDDSRLRRFEEAPQSDEFQALKEVSAAALADLDHDGDLDLVVCAAGRVQFWGNRGDLTFDNVSAESQFPSPDIEFTSIIPVDWDRDVDIDFVLAGPNCDQPGLLENLRHRQFRWQPFGDEYASLRKASSVALADVDGNASWDLIAASDQGIGLVQTQTPAPGHVVVLTVARVSSDAAANVVPWDYDNDGRIDLLSWGGAELRALRGVGDGRFNPAKVFEGLHPQALACEPADLDGDGDIDLALGRDGALDFLMNAGGNKHHWIDVRARGDADTKVPHVNQYGFGSLLEVRAGDLYQAQVIGRQQIHFGLGRREQADAVRVLWTNGVPQDTVQAKGDETICERQALKGSCPYVYTWTGDKYEFFTDLLWAAPIGLQLADGVMAPSRPWEYLKIPGERLKARDGRVQMSVTEELWEATYFDQIELIAVDHPADVEIYSNEKVGPAEMAEFKVHTVREKRLPVAARDQRGRDRLEELRAEDGIFVKSFDRRECLGFAEPHYLELDLGKLDEAVTSGGGAAGPQKITLFLTGWIYPTDVSTNIALSQRAQLGHPKPPSLWTPDESGEWREVRPYMGFPGGKTKTIAIDLTGVFAPGDYRLRIQTTQELYWDAAFFTVDERPAEVKLTPLPPQAVDLHYRGFSEALPKRPNAPETYDYAQVRTAPKWPPMAGRFTRYGEVAELLRATDDKLVVIAAGDEMLLTFAEPPPPAAGWKRDWLLHNVGWDKDADLNTIYGQMVEPLPYRAQQSYPDLDHPAPDDAAYRDYLREFQTRESSTVRFWKSGSSWKSD